MRYVDGEKNWHKYYKDQQKKHEPYARFKFPFPHIAKGLKNHGVECLNATPGSELAVFPMVDLGEVLNDKLCVCA